MDAQIARIFMNDIEVGSIPMPLYKEISKRCRKSKFNKIAQGVNIVHASYKIFVKLINFFSSCLIFSMLALLVLAPEEAKQLVVFFRTAPSEDVVFFVSALFKVFSFLFVVLIGINLPYVFSKFGFKNLTKDSIHWEIRHHLQIPEEGYMTVFDEQGNRLD